MHVAVVMSRIQDLSIHIASHMPRREQIAVVMSNDSNTLKKYVDDDYQVATFLSGSERNRY